MVMPPMVGGVFYEHGHRHGASFVGFLTLVLAVWTARSETRASVRRLAWLALAAVMAQGSSVPHRPLPAPHADLRHPRLPGPGLLLPSRSRSRT